MADLNEGRLDRPRSRARFIAFGMAAVVIFTAARGPALSSSRSSMGPPMPPGRQAVTTMQVPIPAARGLIFDRAGRPLAINVPSWTVKARKADLPGERTGIVLGEVATRDRRGPPRSFGAAWTLYRLPVRPRPARARDRPQRGPRARRAARELPGSWSRSSRCGEYLDENGKVDGTLLAHLVGYTGPWRPRSSTARAAGLPAGRFDRSRGSRAHIREGAARDVRQPARGADGRWAAGRRARDARPPVAGKNLQLTIDSDVQRVATNALRWGMDAVGGEAGRHDRDEPPDRRDPGDGLAAVL